MKPNPSGLRLPSRLCLWSTLLLACLQSALAADTAEDWGRFRGPGGQGVSKATGVSTNWSAEQGLAWKVALPGAGAASPIAFRDRIYVTAYSGYAVPGVNGGDLQSLQRHLLCLRASDGSEIWRRDVAAVQPEEPKIRDHGYAASSPLADADHVYVFFGKSGVHAFKHDGQPAWKADVGSGTHGWGSASSPMAWKDLVIVNAAVESESLVALDRRTGKEVWRRGGMKESWNTPILVPVEGGRTELVVAILGKVLGIDPDTGAELWSCATGIAWYMVPSLVNDGDKVYCIGGRSGGGLAVRAGGKGDVTATHRLWTMKKGSNVSSPLLRDGHLYFFHENLGVLNCVEAATGNLVYEERIGGAGQIYASPILVGDRIYGVARQGGALVLAARPKFELLARNTLGDRSTFDASPALAGRHLLIRSDRYLYAIAPQGGDR